MWRQQLKQRLDGEEEEKTVDFRSADEEQEEKDAVSIDQLHILVVPTDDQRMVLIKEEAPEEHSLSVDQQEQEHLHIKEEEEELWTSLGEKQLNVKEETDATGFSFTAGPLKYEDDEDKPLFIQLHQHQAEVRDLPTSSSVDNLKSATDGESCGGAETTRNPHLSSHEDDSDSSETEVSENDEDIIDQPTNDVKNPDSQLKQLAASWSKSEDTDKDWGSSVSRVPEPGVTNNKNGQKPICCDFCGRNFTKKGDLNKHIRIHTGEKPFCCDMCDQRFITKDSLNTHMRIHTGQKPFCCGLCGQRFSAKCNLNRHTRIHTGQKPFCCELCDRKFITKDNLNKHMRIHTGQKPFCCELCDRRFTLKGHLNTHMTIHTGQKPFGCELCDRRFTLKGHLNTHMTIHTGQKPFCCELCDQRFTEKGSLNRHTRIHTGQKPFCCDFCQRKFTEKGSLNRHMRIHTEIKVISNDS